MILFSSFFIDAFRLLGRTSGLGFLLGAVLIGLKVAVYFSGMRTLRERGDDLRWSHVGDMVRNPRNAFRSGGGETLGGSADNGNNSQTSESSSLPFVHLLLSPDVTYALSLANAWSLRRCASSSEGRFSELPCVWRIQVGHWRRRS